MPSPCDTPVPEPCAPAITNARLLQSFSRRFHAATRQALVAVPPHTTNGDETRYPDKCGTYTKAVRQASPGKVDLGAFATFRTALNSGLFADFEAVMVGGSRTLNGPMAAYGYSQAGADYTQFGDALSPANQENLLNIVPPAPALASVEYATELVELYWCSLLRDVAFTEYHNQELAQEAAHELSSMPGYAGPKHNGHVTPALLFRGAYPGEQTGPYV